MSQKIKFNKICIVGLGYVGIPLALSFAKKNFEVCGFDIDQKKISNLKKGIDNTNESKKYGINYLKKIFFTSNHNKLAQFNIYIVTVPTPVDKKNNPDLNFLKKACKIIGKNLKPRDLVIFESTVYPRTTEDICVPILKKYSKLHYWNSDIVLKNKNYFTCGYSPERINPGVSKNNLKNITKIVSGSNKQTLNRVKKLYSEICDKIFVAKSIQIAESAKIIENTQRDVNIALINEFQKIFNLMGINVYDVLKAAKTKWNFLNFQPGFVGGHCIGVDPYYLAYCSKKIGYNPQLILSGRRLNNRVIKDFYLKIKNTLNNLNKRKILFLGATFKENCNDVRNSKVIELAENLNKSFNLHLYDKLVSYNILQKNTSCKVITKLENKKYDAIIIANKHSYIKKIGIKKIEKKLKNKSGIIFDLKDMFNLYEKIL